MLAPRLLRFGADVLESAEPDRAPEYLQRPGHAHVGVSCRTSLDGNPRCRTLPRTEGTCIGERRAAIAGAPDVSQRPMVRQSPGDPSLGQAARANRGKMKPAPDGPVGMSWDRTSSGSHTMYETDEKVGNTLHPETLRRMREAFEGQICSACGASAVRLYGGRFFCLEHHPRTGRNSRPPRVYHCGLAVGR